MYRYVNFASLLVVVLLAAPALSLELGDPAPPLKVEKWIKGGPIDLKAGEGKTTYVLEFWATWCAPCRASIPHLTEVQKKYKDKGVVVVGISVDGGKNNATRGDVEPFVKEWDAKMEYAVALDTEPRETMEAYLTGFLVQGIPHAFIVDKTGKIVWHGHPAGELDKALDAVLAGKHDLEAAKKADQERRTAAAKQMAAMKLMENYFETVTAKDKPENASELGLLVFIGMDNDPYLLNMLAWDILTRQDVKYRDVKLALRAGKAAVEATKGEDAAILDTYARALFDNGQVKEAIEQQKKAVALAKNDELRAELEQALKQYEEAARK
ncbi:MAG: redoxin domain-containing protein [Planctomycetota bacterium]